MDCICIELDGWVRVMVDDGLRDLKLYGKLRHLYALPDDETMPSKMAALLARLEALVDDPDQNRPRIDPPMVLAIDRPGRSHS